MLSQMALPKLYDRWVRGASEGKLSAAILFDLSAAFDLVDPQLMIRKLRIYGVDEGILSWILSYLCDRQQVV